MFLKFESSLKNGNYILLARHEIHNKNHKSLEKDFAWTMNRLNLFTK
ncbi:hypothetical protein MNB_ARC-1_271 [hydrothermal vent metagenome]|uniref:Uncharacterized protein n=1 Tax=hydrothermal vent metagenome TaxID=652676 RepID=A0A3B1E2M5_9ZZZZ